MSRLSFIGRLLPYFIVRRLAIDRFNHDFDAVLEYGHHVRGKYETIRIPVNCYKIDDGEWVVRSQKKELEIKKSKLLNEIENIDSRLERFSENE